MINYWALLAALPLMTAVCGLTNVNQIPIGSSIPDEQHHLAASTYWYEAISHNGEASFMDNACKPSYKVFRNVVTDFGADNTGVNDASDRIQAAIDAGPNGCDDRTTNTYGSTGKPAVIYLPKGTYKLSKSLQLRIGTVLMGDPTQLPVLKATSTFHDSCILYGKDPTIHPGTNNFYTAIKNLVIDSNDINGATAVTHIDWTVAQATQLNNIVFNMPNFSTGHVGVSSAVGYGDPEGYNSNVILNDLTFNGGATGMVLNGQQWVLKGISFNRCHTGLRANAFNIVVHSSTFTDCTTGIEAYGISGSLTVLDTTASHVGTLVVSNDRYGASNSIVLENVKDDGQTVVLNAGSNSPVTVTNGVSNTWVHGDMYGPGNPNIQYQDGTFVQTNRPPVLTVDGNYFTKKAPTYQEFAVDQVINVKSVPSFPVYGDGSTDDTTNINAILANSINKVVYFPAGTYMVTDTIFIPPNSRIIGDAYASAISAAFSSKFFNPNAPTAMVKLGNSGDVGVGQIVDMLFTVSDVLQGCKLLEVNMAGNQPGDVGIWNSHFRVGGASGSKVKTNCDTSPDRCKAAWGLLHLTPSSSAYIENMWGWTADHDVDSGVGPGSGTPVISTGRGALIEATKGTWLVGTAMEHNTLYQYNFNNAANVCSVFQQSETPYWQGPGGFEPAPAPWADNLIPSDPHYLNCQRGDALCRMAWFELVSRSKDILLYGGCIWVFFNGGTNHPCQSEYCQQNGISITASTGTYLYGTNSAEIQNMIVSDGNAIAKQRENHGGFDLPPRLNGGVSAAYLVNSQ